MEHKNFQNENVTLSNYGQLQVQRKPKVASTPKLSNSFLGLAPSTHPNAHHPPWCTVEHKQLCEHQLEVWFGLVFDD